MRPRVRFPDDVEPIEDPESSEQLESHERTIAELVAALQDLEPMLVPGSAAHLRVQAALRLAEESPEQRIERRRHEDMQAKVSRFFEDDDEEP